MKDELIIKLPARDTMQDHNQRMDTLEQMVDKIGCKGVLEILAEIASTKADHISGNWQDEPLASQWNTVCEKMLTYAENIELNRPMLSDAAVVTASERADISEALGHRAVWLKASIKAFEPCPGTNDIELRAKLLDRLERVNNLLQEKFLV